MAKVDMFGRGDIYIRAYRDITDLTSAYILGIGTT